LAALIHWLWDRGRRFAGLGLGAALDPILENGDLRLGDGIAKRWHFSRPFNTTKRLDQDAFFGRALFEDRAIFPAFHKARVGAEIDAALGALAAVAHNAICLKGRLNILKGGDSGFLGSLGLGDRLRLKAQAENSDCCK
jgi:hypothetical protein